MRRMPMRKIIDALRLRASGLTLREIGASLGTGHSTVRGHLKRCDEAGLSWPLPEGLSEADLESIYGPEEIVGMQEATRGLLVRATEQFTRFGLTLATPAN